MNYKEAKSKYAGYSIIAQGAKDCVPFTQLPKDWEKREATEVIVDDTPSKNIILAIKPGEGLVCTGEEKINGRVTLIYGRQRQCGTAKK